MDQFRYLGVTPSGTAVHGVVEAKNRREAEKAVAAIAARRQITVNELQKKVAFRYKVRSDSQRVQVGEQKAFSKAELEEALEHLGFDVVKVQKKLFVSPSKRSLAGSGSAPSS